MSRFIPRFSRQLFVIDKTTDFPQFLSSQSIYDIKNSFECLSFRRISKPVHSSGKLRWLFVFASNSLLVPMPIVKNGPKTRFFNESAFSRARGVRNHQIHIPFASSIICLPTRVCPMSIGPAVAKQSSLDPTHVCPILTFLTISSHTFPMLKQRGNRRFSSSCHAPAVHPSDPVSRRESSSIRSLRRVQISAGYRQRFGLGVTPKYPATQKSNRHTDIHTDRRT